MYLIKAMQCRKCTRNIKWNRRVWMLSNQSFNSSIYGLFIDHNPMWCACRSYFMIFCLVYHLLDLVALLITSFVSWCRLTPLSLLKLIHLILPDPFSISFSRSLALSQQSFQASITARQLSSLWLYFWRHIWIIHADFVHDFWATSASSDCIFPLP